MCKILGQKKLEKKEDIKDYILLDIINILDVEEGIDCRIYLFSGNCLDVKNEDNIVVYGIGWFPRNWDRKNINERIQWLLFKTELHARENWDKINVDFNHWYPKVWFPAGTQRGQLKIINAENKI